MVEGDQWLDLDSQAEIQGSKFCLKAAQEDWKITLKIIENHVEEYYRTNKIHRMLVERNWITLNTFGFGGIIYGFLGFHRYFVLMSGEVVFSKSHGKSNAEKAEAVGFRIWV